MATDPLSDAKIIDSWTRNARPWTTAVREQQIESRKLVTDAAILDTIVAAAPSSVLDVGCGEGWLVRELTRRGIAATGVDVVPELITAAQRAGGGDFRVASYEDIARGALRVSVDLVVANFSLIGKESVEGLVAAARDLVTTGGSLVIQTLHPVVAAGDTYEDGWRRGSWDGFSSEFTDPAPWYFRTIASWVRLLVASRWRLIDVREPLHPATNRPASVIFVARAAG